MAAIDQVLASDSRFQQQFFFLAKRFVAGETIADAVAAVRALNASGRTATLDFLGEDVRDARVAELTRTTYHELLDALGSEGLEANVSVKLSALGLLLDEDAAAERLESIVRRAAGEAGGTPLKDAFVRVDMEGSGVLEATLRVFERVYARHRNVGPVLQAYLKRTPGDVERAIALDARVRLCKGAYREPPALAYGDMPTIRREFLRCAEALLVRGRYPGIATHDERLIGAVRAFASERAIEASQFEFQMLYGVRPDLQAELVAAGYRVRVYVPFGTHWAGYFYRRISERKENAFLAVRSILR